MVCRPGSTALLAGSIPLLEAVFATFLRDEHLTPVQWLGSVNGVAGVSSGHRGAHGGG